MPLNLKIQRYLCILSLPEKGSSAAWTTGLNQYGHLSLLAETLSAFCWHNPPASTEPVFY